MIEKSPFKGRALLVVSGAISTDPRELILSALNPFNLKVEEDQRILMAGRYIGLFLLALDPAHIDGIARSLTSDLASAGLDIAIEEL